MRGTGFFIVFSNFADLEETGKIRTSTLRGILAALLACAGMAAVWYAAVWAVLPRRLFPECYSTLLLARDGRMLGARIAPDGQWRFPAADSLPDKFVACVTTYEDKRFFAHRGVDPLAVARAVRQNAESGSVVSGGSTITMQLARIARGNRDRNLYEKGVEALWALMIETRYDKRSILALYAAHAPFGGNVVGLEAAAWRYFGRGAGELSWAESATLAVLPNSPALIHPGRNRDRLKEKRDGLLARMHAAGIIDRTEYDLACMEPLPDAPLPLPDLAPHLLERLAVGHRGERIVSSVDYVAQRQVQEIVDRYARRYAAANNINNCAAIVADVETGEVLAYAGNVSFRAADRHGNDVDVITAERSTGSILKPFLYAGMLHDGMLLPGTLVADTPLNIAGFTPQNFNRTFHGAVPARLAIERSLNVPLVRMLSQYNTGRFMSLLKSLGMTTLRFDEGHYGASLVLGGAEGTLWDIAGMYASMSRTLAHADRYGGRYDPHDIRPLTCFVGGDGDRRDDPSGGEQTDRPVLSASAIWFAYEAMSALNRPEEEADWQQFGSMKCIAWKTGTSYGGRDAWSVGTTPGYVVGVWVGNASGEGRPGNTGVGNAAPVLFDIFSFLPGRGWFSMPLDEVERAAVCVRSGYRASRFCDEVDTVYIPLSGAGTGLCPYHRLVHLSADGRWRVNSSCEEQERIVSRSWFVLPPAQEYYYRRHHADYAALPPFKAGCRTSQAGQMEVIYPEHGAELFLPRGFSGERERFVFRAAHAQRGAQVYWHLDDLYLGETSGRHEMAAEVGRGEHRLTLVDQDGNRRVVAFSVK